MTAIFSRVRQNNSPLRNVRRARTLTQADMARLLDVTQQTYSKYESGQLRPPTDVQARIGAVLGVPSRELFPEAVAS